MSTTMDSPSKKLIQFKLLLIDDDEEEYILLNKLLSKSKTLSVDVEWVSTFKKGMEMCKKDIHDIYCVDYNLGEKTGLELVDEVKNTGCDKPIILLTGIDDDKLGMQAIRHGAEDYLVKGEITTHLLERSILYAYERHKAKKHEHERINQELTKKNEQLLTAILNSLTTQIVVIDANAKIIRVNKAWSESAELTSHSEIQQNINYLDLIKDNVSNNKIAEINNGVTEILKGTLEEFRVEFSTGYKEENKKWFLLQATPLQRNEGSAVISHMDITKRIQLEKLKDEFLSIASHELKTPLTTIKGYIQLLTKYIQNEGTPKMIQYVHQADIYTDKLNQLITSLLDISRIQAGKLILNCEINPLAPIIENVVQAMQHLSEKHTLVFSGDSKLKASVDKDRIEQVLMNLISNAMKYTPTTSTISVALNKRGHEAIISIKDEGIGIAPEDQEHLFERFFRVKTTTTHYSGLGIGLYISSEIIKRHGGTISVESNIGKGSCFYFTIPLQN